MLFVIKSFIWSSLISSENKILWSVDFSMNSIQLLRHLMLLSNSISFKSYQNNCNRNIENYEKNNCLLNHRKKYDAFYLIIIFMIVLSAILRYSIDKKIIKYILFLLWMKNIKNEIYAKTMQWTKRVPRQYLERYFL